MKWPEIRHTYPDQWLVVEALEAHTKADNRRHIERFAVIEPVLMAAAPCKRKT